MSSEDESESPGRLQDLEACESCTELADQHDLGSPPGLQSVAMRDADDATSGVLRRDVLRVDELPHRLCTALPRIDDAPPGHNVLSTSAAGEMSDRQCAPLPRGNAGSCGLVEFRRLPVDDICDGMGVPPPHTNVSLTRGDSATPEAVNTGAFVEMPRDSDRPLDAAGEGSLLERLQRRQTFRMSGAEEITERPEMAR